METKISLMKKITFDYWVNGIGRCLHHELKNQLNYSCNYFYEKIDSYFFPSTKEHLYWFHNKNKVLVFHIIFDWLIFDNFCQLVFRLTLADICWKK